MYVSKQHYFSSMRIVWHYFNFFHYSCSFINCNDQFSSFLPLFIMEMATATIYRCLRNTSILRIIRVLSHGMLQLITIIISWSVINFKWRLLKFSLVHFFNHRNLPQTDFSHIFPPVCLLGIKFTNITIIEISPPLFQVSEQSYYRVFIRL